MADTIVGTIAFRASNHPDDVLPIGLRHELIRLLLDGLGPRAGARIPMRTEVRNGPPRDNLGK